MPVHKLLDIPIQRYFGEEDTAEYVETDQRYTAVSSAYPDGKHAETYNHRSSI